MITLNEEFIYSIGEALLSEEEILEISYPKIDIPDFLLVTLKNGNKLRLSLTVEKQQA